MQTLLDAAADVVDEVGFDRLTTAMVAAKAHAAIGTVYRYFPDRLVLLEALRDRETNMFQDAVREAIQAAPVTDIADAADRAIDVFVEMTRRRTGFRVIQAVDPMRDPHRGPQGSSIGVFAGVFAQMVSEKFDLPNDDELLFRMQVIVEVGNALAAHAFVADPEGDPRFVQEAKAIIRAYIDRHYGGGAG